MDSLGMNIPTPFSQKPKTKKRKSMGEYQVKVEMGVRLSKHML